MILTASLYSIEGNPKSVSSLSYVLPPDSNLDRSIGVSFEIIEFIFILIESPANLTYVCFLKVESFCWEI